MSKNRFVERSDIVSWGRVVRRPQYGAQPQFRDELAGMIAEPTRKSKLAIGLRRSYGDSCLNSTGAIIDTTKLDRFIAFDPRTGRLRAEAGISLSEVLQLVVPKGVWQGARLVSGGSLALLGTTTAPGFDQADYEHGDRDSLIKKYPAARDMITALTRE